MQDSCVLLPWDSSFFGVRIGRLKGARLSEQSLSEALAWCRLHEVDCLYFLADSGHCETVRLAERNSFRFVDIRVTLTLVHSPEEDHCSAAHCVRLFKEADLASQ